MADEGKIGTFYVWKVWYGSIWQDSDCWSIGAASDFDICTEQFAVCIVGGGSGLCVFQDIFKKYSGKI